ncbi:MAG: RluA family pseudouridine synthase [Pseudomonadota bacterium]|nr:RluA family pseudouridine synthase [Pseudomonadota bacterium]
MSDTVGKEMTREPVRNVEITPDADGQRVDNFLSGQLKGMPSSRVYRLLRSGQVRVNGGRVKAGYRLRTGDRLRIPPVWVRDREADPLAPPRSRVREALGGILLEDDDIIVINKPGGMAVHGGSGIDWGLIELLRAGRPDAQTMELAHRIDRHTSGCVVIAKHRAALGALHDLFRSGAVKKCYATLLAGRWRGGSLRVNRPLSRHPSGGRVSVDEGGKPARSRFQPIAHLGVATLVKATIDTGRTHQIRVHAASIGHPVAGDAKYGDFEFNRRMRKYGLTRMFLHAESLDFVLPVTGRHYRLTAPLDPELTSVLAALGSGDQRACGKVASGEG